MPHSSQTAIKSGLLLLLTLVLLPLHYYQDKLVVRSNQNLVLSSLQTHKLQLVMGVQVTNSILGLCHQLRNEPSQRIT